MKAMLEITNWEDTNFNCNHVYWVDDGKNKMYAYARWGNPNDTQTFSKPIQFDSRRRQFVEVRHDIYGWDNVDQTQSEPGHVVAGSKGAKYLVTKDGSVYNCTCPGFKFRGACRHIEEVQNNE